MAKKTSTKNTAIGDTEQRDGKDILMYDVTGSPEYKKMRLTLDGKFIKPDLERIAEHLLKVFKGYVIKDATKPGKLLQCMKPLYTGMEQKKEYITVLANVFASKENFNVYFSMLDTASQKMWHYLFFHFWTLQDTLKNITQREWVTTEIGRWNQEIKLPYAHHAGCVMTIYQTGYYSGECYMELYQVFWECYQQFIMPVILDRSAEKNGAECLPEGINWHIYSNTTLIGSQIQVIGQMVQQKAIDYGTKKMTAAMVKKITKQASIPEFFPEAKENSRKILAATLAAPALASFIYDYKLRDTTEYHKHLKTMFQKCSMQYVFFDMISHLSGLNRSFVIDNSYFDAHDSLLQETIATLAIGKWYSLDEIVSRLYANKKAKQEHITVFTSYMVRTYVIHTKDSTLSARNIHDCVQMPVTCGYLALYASCGLIDVAYDNDEGIGPYSFIKYVRLTRLGAYILGITDSYKPEGIHKPSEYFDADTHRLIINCRTIDGQNPYEGLLTNIAEKISVNRYRVTPKSYLSGCTCITDILTKKNFFMDNICEEPSLTWKEFFHDMERRCKPLVQPTEKYSIRQLPPDNKELINIFLTDSYIRQHTIRAEHHLVLIENGYLAKIEERLRAYGYLI